MEREEIKRKFEKLSGEIEDDNDSNKMIEEKNRETDLQILQHIWIHSLTLSLSHTHTHTRESKLLTRYTEIDQMEQLRRKEASSGYSFCLTAL